jgi:NDP-sugar pyrophosphorylase family protein
VDDALPPICILAGGLGARLGERVHNTPKPLLEVAGQPFLLHQLRLLRSHGARRVVLCVGYLGEIIEERIGTEQFGVRIDYSYDSPGLSGTLGAIRRALPLLADRFLVLYGDTYLRVDYASAASAWERSGMPAMMTVLRNRGRWDVSNVEFDGAVVTAYDKQSPSPAMQWIDYGLGGLEVSIVDAAGDAVPDLSGLQQELARRRMLFGFAATERFYEIGTPESLRETSEFLSRTRSV